MKKNLSITVTLSVLICGQSIGAQEPQVAYSQPTARQMLAWFQSLRIPNREDINQAQDFVNSKWRCMRYGRSCSRRERNALRALAAAAAVAAAVGVAYAARKGYRAWQRRGQVPEESEVAADPVAVAWQPNTVGIQVGVASTSAGHSQERIQNEISMFIGDQFAPIPSGVDLTTVNMYEDRYAVDTPNGLFGVYDASGGFATAEFLRKNLFGMIRSNSGRLAPNEALVQAFETARGVLQHLEGNDALFLNFLQEALIEQRRSGKHHLRLLPIIHNVRGYEGITVQSINKCESTGVVALIRGDHIYVANVGDTDAVLVTRDGQQSLTGGIQYQGGAIGDRGKFSTSRPAPKYRPHVTDHRITLNDQALILASDGLWNGVNNARAAQIVRTAPSAQEAADSLQQAALHAGIDDDITVIVLKFAQ